jgi:hypothetical protein
MPSIRKGARRSPGDRVPPAQRLERDTPVKPPVKPPVTKPPHQNTMECSMNAEECLDTYNKIIHAHDEKNQQVYFVLPFIWLWIRVYQYPQLMPFAMAMPITDDDHLTNVPAFKMLFCPGGVGTKIKDEMKISPELFLGEASKQKGFVAQARKFITHYFKNDKAVIHKVINTCSSIWVLGMVKNNGRWFTQILGAVIYSSMLESMNTKASIYIHFVVVKEPKHGMCGEDDIIPSMTAHGDYAFVDNPTSNIRFGDSTEGMKEALAEREDDASIGSRRLGVMLLSLVQDIHVLPDEDSHSEEDSKEDDEERPNAPKLFLQSNISSFAHTRYGVLGFRYATRHMKMAGSYNPKWPRCVDPSQELPAGLWNTFTQCEGTYCCDKDNIRLLEMDEFLNNMYPPTKSFGEPRKMKNEQYAEMFEKWQYTCMLPSPPNETSCNYSQSDVDPDVFQSIVSAFSKNDSKKEAATNFGTKYVSDESEIASALGGLVVVEDNGSGEGIDYSLPPSEQIVSEELLPNACFWVATYNSIYANFYDEIEYSEFRAIMLVFLLRYGDIHLDHPGRARHKFDHLVSLWDADIRAEPADHSPEGEAQEVPPITKDEYKQLWKHDMDDCQQASSVSQRLVTTHFLQQGKPDKSNSSLLILTFKKRTKVSKSNSNAAFLVEAMTVHIGEMIEAERIGDACYYPIVSMDDNHYVNIRSPSSPQSWDDVTPASGAMCRGSAPRPHNPNPNYGNTKEGKNTKERKRKAAKRERSDLEFQYMKWDGHYHFGKVGRKAHSFQLNPVWVDYVWTKQYQKMWKDKKGSFVQLNAGDASGIIDEPPHHFPHLPVEYPQIGKTCLASSFASVLHMAGHHHAAMNLQKKIKTGNLEQESKDLVCNFVNEVNKSKPCDSLGKMLKMKKCANYDILHGPTPASVTLQGDDGGIGHAIAIHQDFIIDASWPFALPRNRETLDWCCSPALYSKPRRVLVLSRDE